MRLFLLMASLMLLYSCKNTSSKTGNDEYVKTVETLEQTEQKHPARFLSATINDKRNLLGQTVVRGKITSSAKVVTYKDIEIKLRFYSKTGALLEEDAETVFETIAPGATVKFKSKYFAPKKTDSVSIQIIGAKL